MGLISSSTIITSLSLFHLTLAFFFLTSPATVADQTLVWVLGESMRMPVTTAFDTASAPLAFLAALFLILGVTDLVACSLPEEISQYHWGTQAPIRLFLFGGLSTYSFFFSSASPLSTPQTYVPGAWGEGLKNRVLFTWAFLEMVTWFWLFITLREERGALARKVQERRAAMEDDRY